MTPEDFYRKKEASWIKALRNKVSTENSNKEKAKAILKVAKKPSNPYKNQQSFSKAMNNLRSKLPTSPRNQAAVVAGLGREHGYHFGGKKHKSVTNETKGKVEKFYYRKDIVYTMPGKGDEMTIWTEEGRKRVHKYFQTMYLKEAYALYLENCEKDHDKCSFSTFCNFCPKNVLL